METLKLCMLSFWYPPKVAPAPYELATNLARLGHEVHVLAGRFGGAPLFEEDNGVIIHRFNHVLPSFLGHIIYELKACNEVFDLNKSEKFDIIHAQGADGAIFSIFKEKFNLPFVVTMHTTSDGELRSLQNEKIHNTRLFLEKNIHWPMMRHLDRLDVVNADRIITVSRYTAIEVVKDYKVPYEKIETIYNGVDSKKFSPEWYSEDIKHDLFEDNCAILFVGRLRIRKGVQYLLQALKLILKNKNDVILLIVGDGESREYLEGLADKLGILKHVKFLGKVSDNLLPKIYATSDIFVLPSLYEGFPLVILEAMASGLPIVATRVSGVPEVVDSNVGILAESKDFAELAEVLTKLIDNCEMRKKMGRYGRERAIREYSWEKIAKQTVQFYKKAIEDI